MGMEVIWIRLYTFFIGPLVYSFAMILAAYLAATFAGSTIYRIWSRRPRGQESQMLWVSLALFGLLPLLTADTRIAMIPNLRVFVGMVALRGGDRVSDADAGGPLVGRRSRSRRTRLCGQRSGLYRGPAGVRLPVAALVWRARVDAHPGPAVVWHGACSAATRKQSGRFQCAASAALADRRPHSVFLYQGLRASSTRRHHLARQYCHRDGRRARHGQDAPGQRHRNDCSFAHHQDDGALYRSPIWPSRPATRSSSASEWAPHSARRCRGEFP